MVAVGAAAAVRKRLLVLVAVVCAQGQKRQRHPDVIVQVALGGMCGIARVRPQDAGDHLCDGGLAVAAGHGDHRQVELRTPGGGQLAQGEAAVGNDQGWQLGRPCGRFSGRFAQHGAGPLGSRLRNELGLRQLPVLALTAGALGEERRKAQEAGMDEFLAKPLNPDALRATLARYTQPPQNTAKRA